MEEKAPYNTHKVSFIEYLGSKGISDKSVYEKLGMAKVTFMKKRNQVEDFTWKEIKLIAEHLNISIDDFIQKFLL